VYFNPEDPAYRRVFAFYQKIFPEIIFFCDNSILQMDIIVL